MAKLRFRYMSDFRIHFGLFGFKKQRNYYDGWNNYLSIGLICFSWITPPLNTEIYRHLKTGNIYIKTGEVINCTNSNDGEVMVIYTNKKAKFANEFVREKNEFLQKFKCIEYEGD